MSTGDIAISIALGLVVNEVCDLSPWLARMIVRRAARLRYGTDARASIRAEEWSDLVDLRPGKLLKLLMSLGFYSAAVLAATGRSARSTVGAAIGVASSFEVLLGGLAYMKSGGDQGRVSEAKRVMMRPGQRMIAWRRLTGAQVSDVDIIANATAYFGALEARLPVLPADPGSFYYHSAYPNRRHGYRHSICVLADLLIIFAELGEVCSGSRRQPSKRMIKAWTRMSMRDYSAFPANAQRDARS